ncbi:tropomodulin domain-containing protein [Ditylenchus destructor]|uniref:Tropomodulin domain-containing protein n=1 Tax=Ditylenchus destructor TaxID=166010 RepID=A0AAD4N4N5_9BILA|nr:tropomodulin domain-containing protein [Ditylenchus destructor]
MSKSDYYAEEKTLAAPKPASAATIKKPPVSSSNTKMGGADKIYGRELREFDDKDIESLLSNLTTEELEDLNNDFDPDNSMLPPSQRCKDQTTKEATGPYQRDKLLKHLEDSAKNEKDWEESVPYSPGIKRGKVFEPKEDSDEDVRGGRKEMQMPIELDLDDEDEEYDEEDIEQALHTAPERDLVDLAGILGMHNVLNQPQYYNALKGKSQDETGGVSFNGVIKAYQPRVVPDEPENETNVEECIKQLDTDDANLEEVNINNMKRVSKERIRSLIKAACKSKYLKKLCLANTAISDSEARPLIELLEQSTSLKVLNIESNFISPELIAKLLRATLVTQSLVEFHAENQRASVLGNQIEMDIMLTAEDNDSLLRVGVSLQSMEARHRVSEALERNYERLRLKRLEEKRKGQ